MFKIFSVTFFSILVISNVFAAINDAEVITIPAGNFLMGCNDGDRFCLPVSSPQHVVHLDSFEIDKYKVTYRRYNLCKDAGTCTDLFEGAACNAGLDWNHNHPVNCVTYKQAEDFCQWDGNKRLLTEAEWEKAARGSDGRIFPWGNSDANCNLAVMDKKINGNTIGPGCGAGTTQPVGIKTAGASPYGVMDMEGNLFEWTSDWYDPNYYKTNPPNSNPKGPAQGVHKVLKGSSWLMRKADNMASSIRSGYSPLGQGYVVGFRCAK